MADRSIGRSRAMIAAFFIAGFAVTIAVANTTHENNNPVGLVQTVETESITVELDPMPEKYQAPGGMPIYLFTASPDSAFWCGPKGPNPYSWVTMHVICREPVDFRIRVFNTEAVLHEVLEFTDVQPAAYRVRIEKLRRPLDGIIGLQLEYEGAVVDSFRIQVPDDR